MKPKTEKKSLEVEIPEGVDVTLEGKTVKVRGEKGEITKKFNKKFISLEKKENKIIATTPTRRKQSAVLGAVVSTIKNMVKGVSEGIVYEMKIVYSHFPMNVSTAGEEVKISNFLGEKHPRTAEILEGVNVEVKGADVVVSGIDKENVAQTAANIEQATKKQNLDPRVFQDGIYLTVKDGKPIK